MSQSMFGQNTVVLALAVHLLMPRHPIHNDAVHNVHVEPVYPECV